MVVQHNMTAMNASRQLGIITGQQSKQSEKLASGYRINRAGDDAAGLKISEKMRSQIRGLQKASTNAQDGVSLIQTAEGALNEAHSILQRMNELAVQGANDTNEGIDRDAINQELTALTQELDRIASTTQFNKQNLLDGSFTNKKLQIGANTNQKMEVQIEAMNATAIGINASVTVVEGGRASVKASTKAVSVAVDKTSTYKYTWDGNDYNTLASANAALNVSKGAVDDLDTRIVSHASTGGFSKWSVVGVGEYTDITQAQSIASAAYLAEVSALGNVASQTSVVGTSTKTSTQSVDVNVTVSGTTATVTAPTVSSYEKAQATLSKIQLAINAVSEQRSALGALQNRLEHTIANLDNVAENTQAAESRIRDTDMAEEMVEYSKNQILAQAGQSMLAQANQSTQGVLSLLQ